MPEARCTVAQTHNPLYVEVGQAGFVVAHTNSHATSATSAAPHTNNTASINALSVAVSGRVAEGRCATSARLYSTRYGRNNQGQASIAEPEIV
jgi:hypothetical protein